MKKLSKIASTLIALVLMLSTLLTFSACSSKSANDKSTSNEEKALSCIDEFMTALEKGDVKAYTKCLDPDIQTIIESGTNSLGNALGIDNAYGLSSSFSTLINSSILESTETKVHYIRKEIQSSAIEEDKASFYIVYTVTVESKLLEKPEQDDCTLEFKLVKKEGKWYIQSYNEISEKTDTEILAEGFNIKYGTNFSDGIAFIQYTDENGNYKAAAIDTSGKIIFEPDEKFNMERVTGYKNGIMVIDNLIYDKTGKIIASPEITGYDKLLTTNCNGYVLAMKTEESFEGDRYYIGLLNNKGKWEQELSTEHPIIQAFEQEGDHIATLSISEDYDY